MLSTNIQHAETTFIIFYHSRILDCLHFLYVLLCLIQFHLKGCHYSIFLCYRYCYSHNILSDFIYYKIIYKSKRQVCIVFRIEASIAISYSTNNCLFIMFILLLTFLFLYVMVVGQKFLKSRPFIKCVNLPNFFLHTKSGHPVFYP